LVLNKVIGTLERLLLKRQGLPIDEEVVEEEGAPVDRLALVKKLAKNKKFVFFVIICGTIAMGSWTWVPCGIPMFTQVINRFSLLNSLMTCTLEPCRSIVSIATRVPTSLKMQVYLH
jgi:hypothetical protein